MFPKIFQFGDFFLPAYGVLVALGVLAGLQASTTLAQRKGRDPEKISNLVVLCAITGLAGAKIAMILFDWESHYKDHLGDIFSVSTLQAAGVFQGGLLLAIAFAWWYMKRRQMPFLETADLLAPGIAIGHGIGRLGCFAAGCCWGGQCDRAWAVVFRNQEAHDLTGVPLNVPLHPTQLYEAFAEFVIFGLLWQRAGWNLRPGAQIGFYLVMYSAVRFGVEFVRSHAQDLVVGLSLTQWMSLGFVALGAWFWYQARGLGSTSPTELSAKP
ncbi:MAG TPA: prolipoprotein diacylglyceryl transferase [Bryobacteraceae bacterium]|nr:prolipoprotein diacylglyceryl transferase [Bryobacteraceae bacterium]